MKKLFYLLSLALMAGFQSCNNDAEVIEKAGDNASMKIIPTIEGSFQSRAAVTAWTKDQSVIGWYLSDGAGSKTYVAKDFMNKKLSYKGTSWTLEPQPQLTAVKGTLYAYYPWVTGLTSFESIPVSVASPMVYDSQTDYMYGAPVSDLSSTNSEAKLTMKHALSRLVVKIKNGSGTNAYVGDGVVSSIKINSDNIGYTGTLNATTGAVTMTKGEIEFSNSQTIDTTGKSWETIIVQKEEEKAPTFKVVLDGLEYTVVGTAFTPKAGNIYTYEISCTSTGLTINNTVGLDNWTTTEKPGTGTLQ